LHPKKYWSLSRPSPGAENNSNPKARENKIHVNKMAHSRFVSLDENNLSKLLGNKDSDSTEKATKVCLVNSCVKI
jgi:hypothetical protein